MRAADGGFYPSRTLPSVTRRSKTIFAALLLSGMSMFVIAGLIGRDSATDVSVSQNPAIDELIPNRGDEVLQQASVGIDLAPEFRLLSLVISPNLNCTGGVEVIDFTNQLEGLNRYVYVADSGKPLGSLSADDNCAVAIFEETSRPGSTQRIDWQFTVN